MAQKPQRPKVKSPKAKTKRAKSKAKQPAGTKPRRHDDWFRLMVESVHDYAVFRLDPGGHIRSWNPGARQIKGYVESEVIGRHFSMFYPADDVKEGKPQRELKLAAAQGRLEDEGWRMRKNGVPFWANMVIAAIRGPKGRLEGFVKVTRDLTQHKEAEEALRRSEQWLATTLRSIGDAVIATDRAGNVMFINPPAEALTGWRQDEVSNVHLDKIFVIVNEQTRQPVTSPFFKVVASGGVIGLANHTVLIARDGTERPIEDSGAPILDAMGDIQGVVLVFHEKRAN